MSENKPKKPNAYAFIDSQNLNLAIQEAGWKLDYGRFRRYLADKYGVTKAFLFLGFIEDNADMYKNLENAGYILVFKPILEYKDGTTKGNVDAEMVLHTLVEQPNYDQAVIVTGDGDFYCLVEHLIKVNKLAKLIIPNQRRYSALLKRFDSGYLAFMTDMRRRMAYTHKRKEPRADQPAGGASRGDSNNDVTGNAGGNQAKH
jgi:uncharacterized LabA/DUF88 family protein